MKYIKSNKKSKPLTEKRVREICQEEINKRLSSDALSRLESLNDMFKATPKRRQFLLIQFLKNKKP